MDLNTSDKKLLSIIIPMYNVELYIEKCLLSTINQNLPFDLYEILVIDDESHDSSIEIVKKIMVDTPNIFLFTQKNKGLGGARNTGISNAKGHYILFLDSDDYLEPNIIKDITELSLKYQLDILEFGARGITTDQKLVYESTQDTYNVKSGYEYLYSYTYMNSACNKLYATELLKNNNLFFIERIYIEDFEFNTRVFYYASRVLGISKIISNFVQSSNSITRNTDASKNKKMIFDIRNVISITLNFKKNIDQKKIHEISVINERISFLTITLLYNMCKLNIESNFRNEILHDLKSQKLYPVTIKTNNSQKELFRKFINYEIFYRIYCYFKSSNLKDLF